MFLDLVDTFSHDTFYLEKPPTKAVGNIEQSDWYVAYKLNFQNFSQSYIFISHIFTIIRA